MANYGLSAAQAGALVQQYESAGGTNVLNCCATGACAGSSVCAPSAAGIPQTASGYYQITNTLWNSSIGTTANAGYPTAISAPLAVQTNVFNAIYAQSGLQNWSGNTPLIAAATAAGYTGSSGVTGTASTATSGSGLTFGVIASAIGKAIATAIPGGGAVQVANTAATAMTGNSLFNLGGTTETWLSSAAVEVGIAILGLGLFVIAVWPSASKTIKIAVSTAQRATG